jgi:23S rRNA pseudouridine1911/1915/1917 synthase
VLIMPTPPDHPPTLPRRIVVDGTAPVRADIAIARAYPQAGRQRIAELFADGAVRGAGGRLRKGDLVPVGSEIVLARAPVAGEDLRAIADPDAAARLDVLITTPEVLAVSKPTAMPSQPLRAGERGCAANGIVALHPECARLGNDLREAGLVHRLDAETTGVLIAARTDASWRALREAFRSGAVHKEYWAVCGRAPARARCDAALTQRGGRAVIDEVGGQAASTEFEVLVSRPDLVLVRCVARTGRMHQVRAHLAAVGAPLVGDARYGGPPAPDGGSFILHARVVALPPGSWPARIEAPLPAAQAQRLRAWGLAVPPAGRSA